MTTLRLPDITGTNTAEQVASIQRYLFTMVQELNFALSEVDKANNGDTSNVSIVRKDGATSELLSEQEALTTFNSLKFLIIKSADIVNAYCDTFRTEFSGEYVASSAFGTYQEETKNLIEANSNRIEQNYSNIQTILTDIERYTETSAWIRSGLLDDSGEIPIYGVEVGQKTTENGEEVFNKFARFVAGGIYFYLPSQTDPIAYMSGTKLYITEVEITKSAKLGRIMCDLSTGIAFKRVRE